MFTVRAYMGEDFMLTGDFDINSIDQLQFESNMYCAEYCEYHELERVDGHFEALDEDGNLVEVFEVHYYLGNPA